MLETLVSSKIRRALFEYLLTHPTDRFYLRGLAKNLGLSISPLRRELKRLEQAGMLQAVEAGNMRFYTVRTDSPQFQELQQVGLPHESDPQPSVVPAQPAAPPAWRRSLPTPALVGLTAAGLALMIGISTAGYLLMTNRQLAASVKRALSTPASPVAIVAPENTQSGVMRGQRWQIVPGSFGGFATGSADAYY